MALTESDATPLLFRKWAGIGLIAASLERRVWCHVGYSGGQPRLSYPNLYLWLVGKPGVGKYIISHCRDILTQVKIPDSTKPAFRVAPSNMTKAALMDELVTAQQTRLPEVGPPVEYHSLAVIAEEFSVFLPIPEPEFINVLNDIYNNPPSISERRRHGKPPEIVVPNPQLTIVGGVQPGWLQATLPPQAWQTGLTSRMIMIYAADLAPQTLFNAAPESPRALQSFMSRLGELSQLFGQLEWGHNAREYLDKWHLAGGPPAPAHSQLEHYTRRRTLHILKISLISAISRHMGTGSIDIIDIERAIAWLTEAETVMPDVFRAMIGHSDLEVLEELHFKSVALFHTTKKPLHKSLLWDFLSQRVPSEKIPKILDSAEQIGMIVRMPGGDLYLPKPKTTWRVE